jgi:FlaA1/EpsC-like NDP-sugar epimerase
MTAMLTREEEELLLNRPVQDLLAPADRLEYAGRTCVVTGAGGSVGSELARLLATCNPARLVLIDHSEHALFRIESRLADEAPHVAVAAVLADVTRPAVIVNTLRRFRPDIVFHAAAYKHVTMAERAICAAARANVLGAAAVLDAAASVGARFVLISTDKAASPRSVMGATKRLAERVTLADRRRRTRPIAVRFGNVLASSGSFVDVMRERIAQGRPVIVTDPDATRYFMTVTEAASLVLRAGAMARGGETYWLDMGEQIRIGDLARRMIEAAVRRGLPRVPIETVGLRPGEKRAEQLLSQGAAMDRTADPRIWKARQAQVPVLLAEAWVRTLRRAVAHDDALAALKLLTAAVHDFVPSERAWQLAREQAADSSMPLDGRLRGPRVAVVDRAHAAAAPVIAPAALIVPAIPAGRFGATRLAQAAR